MSMVEVSHRASEALQKPSMHETAGHKSRLWIFDQVSSARLRGSKKRTHRAALGTTANWAFCELRGLLIGDFVGSKPQAGTAWAEPTFAIGQLGCRPSPQAPYRGAV